MLGHSRSAAAECRRARCGSSVRNHHQGPIIETESGPDHPALSRPADRAIVDDLTLTTISGAADLLAEDVTDLGSSQVLRRDEQTVDCRLNTTVAALSAIRTYRSAGLVLGADTAGAPDLGAVEGSLSDGVLSALADRSPIGFRVDLSDPVRRHSIIDAIAAATGWINKPGDWDVNITQQDGRWVAEVGFLHYSRRIGKLRRQPWSTNPVLAAILCRIAKITSGQRVYDPFCGTGTLLIAAGQAAPGLSLSGTDIDADTLDLARANLSDYAVTARLGHTDAIPFPHPDDSLDRVVSNLPFGKQVGSHTTNLELYPALMAEIVRTLRPQGRAVLLTEDKRLLLDSVARTKGIKIIRERVLRYHGATPTVYTITRIRRSSRSSPGQQSRSGSRSGQQPPGQQPARRRGAR